LRVWKPSIFGVLEEHSFKNGYFTDVGNADGRGFMKYAVEIGSGGIIYIPSFIKVHW
jgi:hypothetical protein